MERHAGAPAGTDGVEGRPRRRRAWTGGLGSLAVSLAIVGVIVGGLWYWEHRDNGNVAPGSDARLGVVELPAAKNVTGEEPVAQVGRAAPDFLLEQPSGGTLRLSDLQGQPVVVNFWASWCGPCRAEFPELVEAYERRRDDGLVIVGVNLQETDGRVTSFAEEFGVRFPIGIDRDGEVADVWRLGGPVEGIPTSYFIDDAGVIRDFFYGPMTGDALGQRLAKILPEEAR